MEYELIFIDAVKAATDAALLLEIEGDEYWCPRSVITDGTEYEFDKLEADFGDTSDEFYIKRWWLEKQGLA